MTDDTIPEYDESSDDREHAEVTPGDPKTENIVMVILGVLCTIAVIVHIVVVFT